MSDNGCRETEAASNDAEEEHTDPDETANDAKADDTTDSTATDSEEAPAQEEVGEEAEKTLGAGPSMEVDVFDMLRATIGLFIQEAWYALGVQARPGTKEVATDLRCARVAIDTTQALIEQLGDEATEEEKREFEQVLANLRVNFVRRQSQMRE